MLLVDYHEPNTIIDKLKSEIPIRVLKLKYGDYSFSDIIIERKSLSDFFSSLKNNRLAEQMENMSRYYTETFLIIEGFFDFSYVNNIDYLNSQITAIILNFDIKVVFSKDEDYTANLINKIYRMKNLNYTFDTSKKEKIYHAVNLFGISRKKLEILYNHFGSIRNIADADKKEFKGIKFIGRKTKEKINNVLDCNIFCNEQIFKIMYHL